MKPIKDIDLINEARASVEGEQLSQYTIYITRDQAQAIQKQLSLRREVGSRLSFSDLVREIIDTGFQGVAEETSVIRSMRKARTGHQ